MRIGLNGTNVLFAAILLSGCKSEALVPCSTCPDAKLKNQWCESCKVGYIAGVPIKSQKVFECLDAHGHDLVISSIQCKTCQAAIPIDGFCEPCIIGWYHKQAYFSRLTYSLAKGRPCDLAAIACPVCRKNSEKYGWCEACHRGMIGNVALERRADFDDGRSGFDLMLAAIEASRRCELCGMAILRDKACFFCKIAYKDGKAVKPSGS